MSDTECENGIPREMRIALAIKGRAEQLIRFNEYDIVTPVPQNRRKCIRIVKTLFEAVARNDFPEVEQLLHNKADPNAVSGRGLPPLHQCIINNNEQIVRLLLHYDADVNATDIELWTPLHVAAQCGNIDIARLLISNGANLLALNDDGNMPYDICEDSNTLDVIESEMAARDVTQAIIDAERALPERKMLTDMKQLHQQGQCLDAKHADGSTYLHVAAAHGFFDVVAFLLRIGIQPSVKDADSWTPLHAAAHWNQADIVEMLCDYGGDINCKTNFNETPLDLATFPETKSIIQMLVDNSEAQKRKRMAFGVRDSRRQSRRKNKFASLMTAPSNDDSPFSSRGAIRRSLRESSGMTLAKLEAQQERSHLYTDDGNAFAKHATKTASKRSTTTDKKPPTESSVNEWLRQLDASTVDTEADFSIMMSDMSIDTDVIVTVITMDHADLVSELPSVFSMEPAQRIALAKQRRIEQRIRFDEYDTRVSPHRRRNPRLVFKSGIALLEATSRGDIKEVEELLQGNSDPNSHNEDGLTPLHQCAIDNNEQVVRLLIHYEADVNAKDTELWTPLHAAACCGYIEIVRLLIANGADLLAVNTEGNMPYDICDDENTLDVIESEMAARGITQELIDQERAKPERQMLNDMKLLHQQGQPLDVRQSDGSTYLHAAAANGYYDVVAFLLRVGFQPTVRDNDYWTPVHAAAHWNQPEIIEMLCEYGADINVKTATHETPLELAEDANTKTVIQTLINNHEAQKKKRLAFGVRDSRRQSRRKKKYESPGQIPGANGDNPFSARGAIRRQSLRDRSGLTPARLEAAQEQSNLIRSWSREDVANHGDGDVSQYHGGRYAGEGPSRGHHRDGSPQKRNLRPSNKDNKATKMSPDEWLKQLNSEPYYDGDEDFDNNGGLNRSQRGRSGSRKKKKKAPNDGIGEHELTDMRNVGIPGGNVPMNGSSGNNATGKANGDREKTVCCCTIL